MAYEAIAECSFDRPPQRWGKRRLASAQTLKLVLSVAVSRTTPEGRFWQSVAELGRRASVEPAAARRALRALEAHKVIIHEPWPDDDDDSPPDSRVRSRSDSSTARTGAPPRSRFWSPRRYRIDLVKLCELAGLEVTLTGETTTDPKARPLASEPSPLGAEILCAYRRARERVHQVTELGQVEAEALFALEALVARCSAEHSVSPKGAARAVIASYLELDGYRDGGLRLACHPLRVKYVMPWLASIERGARSRLVAFGNERRSTLAPPAVFTETRAA